MITLRKIILSLTAAVLIPLIVIDDIAVWNAYTDHDMVNVAGIYGLTLLQISFSVFILYGVYLLTTNKHNESI